MPKVNPLQITSHNWGEPPETFRGVSKTKTRPDQQNRRIRFTVHLSVVDQRVDSALCWEMEDQKTCFISCVLINIRCHHCFMLQHKTLFSEIKNGYTLIALRIL